MERTTKSQVETAFKWFVQELGGHLAVNYKDVGGYGLEYASCYGGYAVYQICNEHGGQSNPFGSRRMSASEMYQTLWFANQALKVAKQVA